MMPHESHLHEVHGAHAAAHAHGEHHLSRDHVGMEEVGRAHACNEM